MATNIDFRQQITEPMLLQRIALRIGSLLDLEILLEEIVGDVAQTLMSWMKHGAFNGP